MAEEKVDPAVRTVLIIILAVLIIGMLASIILPQIPVNDHPPQVTIIRHYQNIEVKWDGGTDSAFVGNFSVTMDNVTTYYKKPDVFQNIAVLYHPEQVCVDVKALDLSVRTYRPIGYNCT